MIIQPIEELSEEGNRILANKKRMKYIKNIITNECDKVFLELEKSLMENSFKDIAYITSHKIFFEVVDTDLLRKLQKLYILQGSEAINKLKESYKIRGVKGINFAWTPILERLI